ncbi:MAG: hypothetical protein OXR72_07220 [Gemmatimonadota bacterium]|nr:hypothetical protein [Gemmatimonadota bacterium]
MTISRILPTAVAASIGLCVVVPLSDARETPRVTLVESQLEIRAMQTRAFDTSDENKTLRAIVATLQDFGFVIKKADEALGTITARRVDKYPLRLTVTVRPRGETQVLVRMNAYYGRPVRDPVIYLNFFKSLEKSMFLAAHSVE